MPSLTYTKLNKRRPKKSSVSFEPYPNTSMRKTENELATVTSGPVTPVTRRPTNKMDQRYLPYSSGPINPKAHAQLLGNSLRLDGDRQRLRTANPRPTYQHPTRLHRKLLTNHVSKIRWPIGMYTQSSHPCKRTTIRNIQHQPEDPKSIRQRSPTT